ncbi:MAG: adenosine deaminase [Thermoanaerobaculia bacterium]|nr:adenosine deaminase [Thermoanaerobaculia bacterium]
MSLEAFLLRMPKAELHVHLEGSLRPATLLHLARKNRVPLPADDLEGIRRWFRFPSFEQFIEIYITCSRCLRDGEDFYLLAQDFLAEQAVQNVLYTAVHFTISTHIWNGADGEEIRAALSQAIAEGESRHGVRMRLIPDIVRNLEPERADATVEWALADRDAHVVALGMGGMERGHSSAPFRRHFDAARAGGLHCVAHAGETGGADSIREALEHCGAERIGHGIRAIDDPALTAELAARGTPLEICPSSNVALGNAASIEEHPVDRLLAAGVQVSIGSDDPPLFDTNLTREYVRLHRAFGYDAERLAELSLAAVRHSFLPAEEKEALEHRFREELRRLGVGPAAGSPDSA